MDEAPLATVVCLDAYRRVNAVVRNLGRGGVALLPVPARRAILAELAALGASEDPNDELRAWTASCEIINHVIHAEALPHA